MAEEFQNIKVAVDAIVFGYRDSQLFILLIKRKYSTFQNQWALPGGFVLDHESLQKAVTRELKEETGVEVDYLEQLYTFGDEVKRDPRGRVISVAYFGLVSPDGFDLVASTDAIEAQWFPSTDLPKLAFDHIDMVNLALERLSAKLHYQPIGFDLLPKEFLFSDLENLYMTVFQQELDRRNFRKKILNLGFVEETGKSLQKGSGRIGKTYRFNERNYRELERVGYYLKL